jgi:dynein heavy chain
MVRQRRTIVPGGESSDDGEGSRTGRGRTGLDRRTLLRTVPVVGAVGLAGCTSVEDAVGEFLEDDAAGGSDESGPDTTTFGYGGTKTTVATTLAATTTDSVTDTATGTQTATGTESKTGTETATGTESKTGTETATATGTPTATETATATPTTTAVDDDYGDQGYGEYGFGGVR